MLRGFGECRLECAPMMQSKDLDAILIGRVSVRNAFGRMAKGSGLKCQRGNFIVADACVAPSPRFNSGPTLRSSPSTAPNCSLYAVKSRPIGTRFGGKFQTASA